MKLLLLSCLLVVAGRPGLVQALTYANQTEVLLRLKQNAVPRGGGWAPALATWVCPTPTSSNPDGSCDPCGDNVPWGHFEHVGCREWGTGFITNIHITDFQIADNVPAADLCELTHLTEFDVDGGNLTGPIPVELSTCFPKLMEIDLSYNQLTGSVPAFLATIKTLEQLKLEENQLVGTIPPELGSLPALKWLRMADNKMEGSLPATFSRLADEMVQIQLDNNNFEGNLYPLAEHSLINAGTVNNPRLCGMVPVGVRFAHGFNPYNTGLGLPCPEETARGSWVDLSSSI